MWTTQKIIEVSVHYHGPVPYEYAIPRLAPVSGRQENMNFWGALLGSIDADLRAKYSFFTIFKTPKEAASGGKGLS